LQVPFKRLLGYMEGEYLSAVGGCIASAASGAQHPAFAFTIASMISIFYTTDVVRLAGSASFNRSVVICLGLE
jgi:ATP-binding cassette subfamily B (MDR/TAP) protein 1